MTDDGGGIRTDVRRGGARPSFDDLYDQTYAAVYNYAYFRLLNHALAEDVVSEAYLRAWRSFDNFDAERASFVTWVLAIARNVLADLWKKQRETVDLEDVPQRLLSERDSYDGIDDTKETADRLLACLSEEERELVFMKYWLRLRNVEVARQLGMNTSTVSTRLSRALKKMRAAGIDESLTCANEG